MTSTYLEPLGLSHHLRQFSNKHILVVGDMVADQYVVGKPARISREAPVLILHHSEEFVCPGGAANVAHNLSRLGAHTYVAGVVGNDGPGRSLHDALDVLGINTEGLIVDPTRPTATKTRVVGRGDQEIQQQIVRIDRVDDSLISGQTSDALIAAIHGVLDSVDAVVISDYENGVISPTVLDETLPRAIKTDRFTAVDSHGDLFRFKGVTVATPNQPEAEGTLGRIIRGEEELEQAGIALLEGMGAQAVLLTRGSQGMSLFEQGGSVTHLRPSNLREVFDPSGAGDTTCAVFTLALLSGASCQEAAALSNIAAGEVVKRLGAAAITQEELTAAVHAADTRL